MRRALLLLAACHPHAALSVHQSAEGNEVALYRDAALIRQRVEVDVPAGGEGHAAVAVSAGVDADAIVMPDLGALSVRQLRVAKSRAEIIVTAPHAGHYAFHVAYLTDKLTWAVAYTLTTTPRRERAVLRGGIAIANASGIAIASARISTIDLELGDWRGRSMELLSNKLVGGGGKAGTPPPPPRELGIATLERGQTRLELVAHPRSQPMRSVLVYDGTGPKLDNNSTTPIREPALGVVPAPATRVTESFEVARDRGATAELPSGRVRLLEQRADGTLAVLGESSLFEASTKVASVDTITVGTASGVTAHRERRELTVDEDGKRITEEFHIVVDNTRPEPVEIVIREHFYRSVNWTLAYHSALEATKEGAQAVALRTRVPAKGRTELVYVVVYGW